VTLFSSPLSKVRPPSFFPRVEAVVDELFLSLPEASRNLSIPPSLLFFPAPFFPPGVASAAFPNPLPVEAVPPLRKERPPPEEFFRGGRKRE